MPLVLVALALLLLVALCFLSLLGYTLTYWVGVRRRLLRHAA
jgi:hypothetical protein